MYLKLLDELKEDIKLLGKQQKDIAPKLGMTPENFSLCLKNTVKFKFVIYVNFIKELYDGYKEKQKEQILKFIEVTPRLENIRESLEWSYNHCEMNVFEFSINRALKEEKLWETAKIYQLVRDRRTGKDILSIFDRVEELKVKAKIKDNIALLSILSLNILEDLNKFSSIGLYSRQARKNINSLKKGYVRDSYCIRLKEIELLTDLKEGRSELVIEKGEKFLIKMDYEKFPLSFNYVFLLLAQAYIFTDSKKAISYVTKALELINKSNIHTHIVRERAVKSTYDFIKIHFGDLSNLLLEDEAEKAHLYAKIGNVDDALRILNDLEYKNGKLTPFQLYYKALCTLKSEDFNKAKDGFVRSGDFHYSQLIY